MTRHYSTKDFFRQMPNRLLARYFQERGLFAELDFATMRETKPDALFAAILSVIESCRRLGSNPRLYLTDILPGLACKSIQSLKQITPAQWASI